MRAGEAQRGASRRAELWRWAVAAHVPPRFNRLLCKSSERSVLFLTKGRARLYAPCGPMLLECSTSCSRRSPGCESRTAIATAPSLAIMLCSRCSCISLLGVRRSRCSWCAPLRAPITAFTPPSQSSMCDRSNDSSWSARLSTAASFEPPASPIGEPLSLMVEQLAMAAGGCHAAAAVGDPSSTSQFGSVSCRPNVARLESTRRAREVSEAPEDIMPVPRASLARRRPPRPVVLQYRCLIILFYSFTLCHTVTPFPGAGRRL